MASRTTLAGRERVLVLVKAVPHAGERQGETVCCAGVTATGEWRRQYPIHFRRLRDNKFKRWQWIEYDYMLPQGDKRTESRRVQEDTIELGDTMPSGKRAGFLDRVIVPSVEVAAARNQSLALIRPVHMRFHWIAKSQQDIATERATYEAAAKQTSFLDKELAALDPCPFAFKYDFETEDGKKHKSTCEDWETSAMFYNFRRSLGTTGHALAEMSKTFNEKYPRKGVVFAMGTHRFRPIWLLVGVIRLDKISQTALAL
jgi:hypothetical protein